MDTVWLVLHTVVEGSLKSADSVEPKTYMFGPTGIVSFKQEGDYTMLQDSRGYKELVEETPLDILCHIGRIRKTIKPKRSPKKKANVRRKT